MRVVYATIGSILFFTLVVRCTASGQKKNSNRSVVWKETIGSLDPRGYKKGTIYYVVNGVTYHADFEGITDKVLKDQKFTMRYEVNNPEEVQIDYWNPVFVKGEKTHLLVAQLKKVTKKRKYWSPIANVTYAYKIPFQDKPREIERWIYLPNDYEQRYPNLREGQYYEVEVWDENVYRSVLHLDRPVKDTINAK